MSMHSLDLKPNSGWNRLAQIRSTIRFFDPAILVSHGRIMRCLILRFRTQTVIND